MLFLLSLGMILWTATAFSSAREVFQTQNITIHSNRKLLKGPVTLNNNPILNDDNKMGLNVGQNVALMDRDHVVGGAILDKDNQIVPSCGDVNYHTLVKCVNSYLTFCSLRYMNLCLTCELIQKLCSRATSNFFENNEKRIALPSVHLSTRQSKNCCFTTDRSKDIPNRNKGLAVYSRKGDDVETGLLKQQKDTDTTWDGFHDHKTRSSNSVFAKEQSYRRTNDRNHRNHGSQRTSNQQNKNPLFASKNISKRHSDSRRENCSYLCIKDRKEILPNLQIMGLSSDDIASQPFVERVISNTIEAETYRFQTNLDSVKNLDKSGEDSINLDKPNPEGFNLGKPTLQYEYRREKVRGIEILLKYNKSAANNVTLNGERRNFRITELPTPAGDRRRQEPAGTSVTQIKKGSNTSYHLDHGHVRSRSPSNMPALTKKSESLTFQISEEVRSSETCGHHIETKLMVLPGCAPKSLLYTRCHGTCHSRSVPKWDFDQQELKHIDHCTCCTNFVMKFKTLRFVCPGRPQHVLVKTMGFPFRCACRPCDDVPEVSAEQPYDY